MRMRRRAFHQDCADGLMARVRVVDLLPSKDATDLQVAPIGVALPTGRQAALGVDLARGLPKSWAAKSA